MNKHSTIQKWRFSRLLAGMGCGTPPWLVVAAVCVCLAPAAGRSQEVSAAPTATVSTTSARYFGNLRLDYEYRNQDDASDSDLYGYWSAGGRNLEKGTLDFYLSGRMHRDLNGNAHPDGTNSTSNSGGTFNSLDDARGVLEQRVLQAYVDIHDRPGDLHLRLGRQYVDIADYLLIDGAQAILFENQNFGGRVFFGAPVSYYPNYYTHYYPTLVGANEYVAETNRYKSATHGWAGGASLVGTPWEGNRTRLTYVQYYDSNENLTDHNFLLDAQQRLMDGVQLRGRASFLNDSFRMGALDVSCFTPTGDTSLFFGASRWGQYDARTVAYSPLLQQLDTLQPYTYLYARLSQAISPSWTLSPGVTARFADAGNPNYSNRDYQDYDLTLSFAPCRQFSSSLSAQYWYLTEGDSFLGLTGEICFRKPKVWETSLGCSYSAYSYSDMSYAFNSGGTWISGGSVITEDGTVETTTPYSLTYFARAKWYAARYLILRLQGSIEDDKMSSALGFWGRASAEVKF